MCRPGPALTARSASRLGRRRQLPHRPAPEHLRTRLPGHRDVPFEIPLGALLPQRLENLLAAGKSIGTTHITNGCYRLHPVEWGAGEAAGALAAWCLRHASRPASVRAQPHLEAFQRCLQEQGIQLHWPTELRGCQR